MIRYHIGLLLALTVITTQAADSQEVTIFNKSGVPLYIRKDSDKLPDGAKGCISCFGSKDIVEPGERKSFVIENRRLNYTPVNHPVYPDFMEQDFLKKIYEVPITLKEKTITLPSSDVKEFTLVADKS